MLQEVENPLQDLPPVCITVLGDAFLPHQSPSPRSPNSSVSKRIWPQPAWGIKARKKPTSLLWAAASHAFFPLPCFLVKSVLPRTGDEMRIGPRAARHCCNSGGPARGNGASPKSSREKGDERNKSKPLGEPAAAGLHHPDPCLPSAAAVLGGKRGLQARCCSTAKAERVQTHRPGRFGQGDGNNLGVGEGNGEILHGRAQRGDSPQGGTVLSTMREKTPLSRPVIMRPCTWSYTREEK